MICGIAVALLSLLALLLWLPTLSAAVARVTSPPQSEPKPEASEAAQRIIFLVPAHNEEVLVGRCVESVRSINYPIEAFKIVVVADNCDDATAEVVRRAGADCWVRSDPERPGKPQAISWAIPKLGNLEKWDTVVILDADSVVNSNFGWALTRVAPLRHKMVQVYNGICNEDDTWLTRLAGVLIKIRYEMELPRKRLVGLNCPLTGNGLCFGTELLRKDGWTAYSLTENWELYARYTAEGVLIDFAPDAKALSQESDSLRHSSTRKRRWLAGRLGVLFSWLLPVLSSKHIRWQQKLDIIAELSAPGPVLQTSILGVVCLLTLLACRDQLPIAVLLVAAASLVPLAVKTLIVIVTHQHPAKIILAFLMLPLYAGWRLIVAFGTLTMFRDKTWRGTDREPDARHTGIESSRRKP